MSLVPWVTCWQGVGENCVAYGAKLMSNRTVWWRNLWWYLVFTDHCGWSESTRIASVGLGDNVVVAGWSKGCQRIVLLKASFLGFWKLILVCNVVRCSIKFQHLCSGMKWHVLNNLFLCSFGHGWWWEWGCGVSTAVLAAASVLKATMVEGAGGLIPCLHQQSVCSVPDFFTHRSSSVLCWC